MQTTLLTAQLTDEFGHLVPASMIERTVQTAADMPRAAAPDDVEIAVTARMEVQALAEAVRRRPAGAASRWT